MLFWSISPVESLDGCIASYSLTANPGRVQARIANGCEKTCKVGIVHNVAVDTLYKKYILQNCESGKKISGCQDLDGREE